MARKTNKKNIARKTEINKFSEDNINKYFWFVIPVLTIIYFFISKYSVGFYQDDEIAQYLNAVKFKIDPFSILGNNPKPGWKIFLIIPAIFGYQPVILLHSFIAALTVFVTYYYIRISNLKFAYFGAILMAFQPLYFDLSFRAYSEIFTAFLIVLLLIFYKKDKFFISGLICGYIFTIRQEIAIFCAVLFIIYIYKRRFISAISIIIFPLLYNILGYLKSGDFFYILSEMRNVASLVYNSQGIFHYFKVYIFIIGPVSLTLFLTGFLGFIAEKNKYKEYISKYLLEYIIFISIFAVHTYTMWNNGPNPGNWRYLLHISPVVVLFATLCINNLVYDNYKRIFYWISGTLLFLTLIFLSKTSDGYILLESSDYTKAFIIAVIIIIALLLPKANKENFSKRFSYLMLFLAIIYLFVDFKPKNLSAENITVKSSAEFIENSISKTPEVYCNHSLLMFFMNNYSDSPSSYKSLIMKNLESAPVGSIVVWDNHYGYRPEWGADVKLDYIQNNDSYRQVNQFVSVDRRFNLFIFEKIK